MANDKTIKANYPVLNMSCAACAVGAEGTVKNVDGVVNASVNFATGSLSVEYRPNETNIDLIKEAVQSAGFDLLVEEEKEQQKALEAIEENKLKKLKRKTLFAVLLSIPVVVIGMFFMHMP